MRKTPEFSLQQTLAQVPGVLAEFENRVAGAAGSSILFSEMLFLFATLADARPARIFESGRGNGISTRLLAACFPETEIISVELDQNSLEVPVAQRNLIGFTNVKILFGDARQMLPEMVQPGDAVLIDGPHDVPALRLALQLLRDHQPCAVFLHDCHRRSWARDFLNAAVPQAFYSDEEIFMKRYQHLDIRCWGERSLTLDGYQAPGRFRGNDSSYGPTLACIPNSPGLSFSWLAIRLFLAALLVPGRRIK